MLQIQDLVSVDEQARFRNDVQISDFTDESLNLGLLRSYLFSKSTSQGEARSISPVGVLDKIIDVFLHEGIENRMAVIADYGHGKSHLALALTNFFSKSLQSDEVKILLTKLSNEDAGGNEARYRSFKESKGEFFVIRLRGDEPKNLTQQFYSELTTVLKEHDLTRDVIPPLWSVPVNKYLRSLSEDQINSANRYLQQHNIDLPLLIQMVDEHLSVAYDISVKLVEKLTKVVPNFQATVGIANSLDWLVQNYCGFEKPFGGVLVIVDEFSLYIQKYAKNDAVGELMDLLNGVERNSGKCAFVAFGQHDPSTTAKNFSSGVVHQNLEHELTRIPTTKRYLLYSLLESVIDAYLIQSDQGWGELFANTMIADKFQEANDLAFDVFRSRYVHSLHWQYEIFEKNVSKGCYPLHPITTTLLCSLEFQASAPGLGVPRNVLGFVLDEYERKRSEPSVIDQAINWILPISLVDYFKEMLPSEGYNLYKKAINIAGNDDCPPEENAVLKALLIQEISKVNPSGQQQEKLLAQCSGLDVKETQRILQDLVKRNCIKYEEINHRYGFWAAGIDPLKLDNILRHYADPMVIGQKSIDDLKKIFFSKDISVSVDWGNSLDWVPDQRVFLPSHFTKANLNEIIKPSTKNPISELIERPRGYVFWLLPRDEDEVHSLKNMVDRVLNEVIEADYPIPILVVLPDRPCVELFDWIRRKLALEMFSEDERIQVGLEIYTHELANIMSNINDQITKFLGGESTIYASISRKINSYVTPAFSQASILNEFGHLGEASIEDVLQKLYRLAYNSTPNYFITHLRVNTAALQNAVKIILGYLLKNKLSMDEPSIQSNSVAKDICSKILVQKWKILSNQWNIIEPADPRIKKAWELIDNNFDFDNSSTPKMVKLESIISKLLNPPFGYDTNTLSLLLCSWLGYYSSYVKVFITGEQGSYKNINNEIANGPKKFILNLVENNYSIIKTDPGEKARRIKEIIAKVQQMRHFSTEEAKLVVVELKEFIDLGQGNPADIVAAEEAQQTLFKAKSTSEKYDSEARAIKDEITNAKDISRLISLQNDIRNLNPDSIVERHGASPAELKNSLDMRLSLKIESLCTTYEKLSNIQSYELNKQELNQLKSRLEKNGFEKYLTRVKKSLTALEENLHKLQDSERERPLLAQIKQMDISANLSKLLEYDSQLNKIQGLTESSQLIKKAKQEDVQEKIQQYRTTAEELTNGIDSLDSQFAIEKWSEKYLRNIEKFTDTNLHNDLNHSYLKVQQIRVFLDKLTNVVRKEEITSPQKAEETQKNLAQLQSDYFEILSDRQKELIKVKQGQLDEIINQKTDEANDWLNETETALLNGTLSYSALLSKVLDIPDFLPKSKLVNVEKIKIQIQKVMEKDSILTIETEFKKLPSREIREECIKRLQELLNKENTK